MISFIAQFEIDEGTTDLVLETKEYDPSPDADYESWLLLQGGEPFAAQHAADLHEWCELAGLSEWETPLEQIDVADLTALRVTKEANLKDAGMTEFQVANMWEAINRYNAALVPPPTRPTTSRRRRRSCSRLTWWC